MVILTGNKKLVPRNKQIFNTFQIISSKNFIKLTIITSVLFFQGSLKADNSRRNQNYKLIYFNKVFIYCITFFI